MLQESISLIIPARGSAPYLFDCLRSALQINYYLLEIIVVDDGLDKDTRLKLDSLQNKITVLESKGKGPSYARNLAANFSKAAYLAFTDSDCILPRDWIAQLFSGFEYFPSAVACGGIQLLPQESTPFEKEVFSFFKKTGFIAEYSRMPKKSSIFKVRHNPSCNVMYKREIFLREGGFLEGLWPGEDIELDYRLTKRGYLLVCNPQAIVYHHRPRELRSFCLMMHRYGLTQGYLVKRYGFFRRLHFLALFSLGGLILAIFIFFYNKIYFFIFGVGLFLLTFFYFQGKASLFKLFLLSLFYWQRGFWRGLFYKLD